MTDERIELAPWIVDMAQRVVDNNSGEWLTPTWIVAQEVLGSVDGLPNDGHSEFVALLIDDIVATRQRLAAAEASTARDRIKLVAWVLRNMDWFGCFSGDCPHDLNSECIQSIIDQYVEDEAAKAKGGRDE